MKVLFVGDSITNGKIGESFVELIGKRNPSWQIQNLGRDGETFNRIIERLIEFLEKDNSFDLVVLQGGYNDLLLPTFRSKGWWFRLAYQQQLKKGLKPLAINDGEAHDVLAKSIKKIKRLFSERIILVTIGCLGENLQSKLNQQRSQLNNILEKIAADENISVTHTQKMFDEFLQNRFQSNYCVDNFWAIILIDRFTRLLSAQRKLHLTIDGVHLNRLGAEIFADSVLEIINSKSQSEVQSSESLR